MDYDDFKLSASKQYENKFKRRGKVSKYEAKSNSATNCHSMKCSRPSRFSGNTVAANINLMDTKQHQIVDTIAKQSTYKLSSHSDLNYAVTHKPKIQLNKAKTLPIKKKYTPPEARIIHLDKIHPHLFLGNIQAADLNQYWILDFLKIRTIINLSDTDVLPRNYSGIKIFNCGFKDTRYITNRELFDHYQTFENILSHRLCHGGILVCCQKGVNRSSTMVLNYAINQGMTFKTALEYLEQQRKEYKYWYSLNNRRLYKFLVESEKKYKEGSE